MKLFQLFKKLKCFGLGSFLRRLKTKAPKISIVLRILMIGLLAYSLLWLHEFWIWSASINVNPDLVDRLLLHIRRQSKQLVITYISGCRRQLVYYISGYRTAFYYIFGYSKKIVIKYPDTANNMLVHIRNRIKRHVLGSNPTIRLLLRTVVFLRA